MMEFNIPPTLIALLSFLLFLFMFLKSIRTPKSANSYSLIPGPKTLPFIGNLHLMLRAAAPHHMFRDLAAIHGPLMHLHLGEIHFLIISSVDLAKQVVKTHDVNFANRPPGLAAETLSYNHTDVVSAPYSDQWRQLRKICTLELLSARRVQSFRPIREEENVNLCKRIASCQGSPTDLSEKLYLSSYDVITRAAVGAKTKEREMVTSLILESLRLGSGFMIADLYPSIKLLPLITGAQFKIQRLHRRLDRLFDSIIEQHRSAANTDDGAFEDLVDVLLKIHQDGSLTTNNIKAVLLNMFTAGTDTSTTEIGHQGDTEIASTSAASNPQNEHPNM